MKVTDLTNEQLTAALARHIRKVVDPVKNKAEREAFRAEYNPFLELFFKNENEAKIVAFLTKVALLIPEAAVATGLATGFIAGFNAAVAALTIPQQEAQPVGSQLS